MPGEVHLPQGPDGPDVERLVCDEIGRLLEEHGKGPADVAPEHALDADLGLSSSDLVRLVAILAARLGVDPFDRSASITDVRTVRDLCRLYEGLRTGAVDERAAVDRLLADHAIARARRSKRTR